jgi:hypothetical protein
VCPRNNQGAAKVVDKLAAVCQSCGAPITAIVLEGDPGYVVTGGEGNEKLFLPQGSTSPPVSSLSAEEQSRIIAEMKAEVDRIQRAKKKAEVEKHKKGKGKGK